MKKLQVKQPDGTWAWVFGRRMPEKTLQLTPEKRQALPPNPIWGQDDLEWARKQWPEREFRLAETLDQ